jgi:hypothetical protein
MNGKITKFVVATTGRVSGIGGNESDMMESCLDYVD